MRYSVVIKYMYSWCLNQIGWHFHLLIISLCLELQALFSSCVIKYVVESFKRLSPTVLQNSKMHLFYPTLFWYLLSNLPHPAPFYPSRLLVFYKPVFSVCTYVWRCMSAYVWFTTIYVMFYISIHLDAENNILFCLLSEYFNVGIDYFFSFSIFSLYCGLNPRPHTKEASTLHLSYISSLHFTFLFWSRAHSVSLACFEITVAQKCLEFRIFLPNSFYSGWD